MRSWKSAWM